MSLSSSNSILLPEATRSSVGSPRIKLAAFVPITLALFGVSAILFGGLSARSPQTAATQAAVDPVVTGSIASPEEQRRALQMLDR